MQIINLIDNIAGASGCGAEHGLSYYVETKNHKLLIDTGASDLFSKNAAHLGIDLKEVDTVILSHGHYDHGGGLPTFFKINDHANVYMQSGAFGAHYGIHEDGPHYIGLAQELKNSGRILFADEDLRIDDELFLLADIPYYDPLKTGPWSLSIQTENGLRPDDFRHEQCLVITQGRTVFLFSGCAHHGILNIMKSYREHFGSDPDYVFSGFHLKKRSGYNEESLREIARIANELKTYDTIFYTGHCTGDIPFDILKRILGDRLEYAHCGDEIAVKIKE